MTRPWVIELRRGVGSRSFPLLVLALAATAAAHPRDWAGDWLGWGYYQRTSLVVYGPLVAAAAAWQGGRERRAGLEDLLASCARGRLARATASVASPAAWSLAAFLMVFTAMAVITATTTTFGGPPLLVSLSAAAAVLMFACAGYAIGSASRWRLTAPALALGTYVALAVVSYGGRNYLSPAVELRSPLTAPAEWAALSIVTFLAVAVAALQLLDPRTRPYSAILVLTAVLAAAPISALDDEDFPADAAAQRLVCEDGSPQVCVTARHADQLPVVADAIQATLAGLGLAGRIEERRDDELGPGDTTQRINQLYLDPTVTGGADLEAIRRDAARAAVTWDCPEGPFPPDDELFDATVDITDWLLVRSAPAEAGVLKGRTPPMALAATRAFIAAAADCNPEAARRAIGRA